LTPAATINASYESVVSASAIVIPHEVSQMGSIITAPVKEVAVKEGDNVHLGQSLVVLDTPDLEFLVAKAEAALRSARLKAELQKYRHTVLNRFGSEVDLSGPPEAVMVTNVRVQQAQAALEMAQAALAQGTLAAPYDGVVVSINAVAGELVQSGQVVITLRDSLPLQIATTDLSERDIRNIDIGQSATVFVEALEREFSGKVITIASKAEQVGGDVVYKVTIELDEQPPSLLWGMSAEVHFQIESGS
jgi:RND family efflux transporter MFP subunit